METLLYFWIYCGWCLLKKLFSSSKIQNKKMFMKNQEVEISHCKLCRKLFNMQETQMIKTAGN